MSERYQKKNRAVRHLFRSANAMRNRKKMKGTVFKMKRDGSERHIDILRAFLKRKNIECSAQR